MPTLTCPSTCLFPRLHYLWCFSFSASRSMNIHHCTWIFVHFEFGLLLFLHKVDDQVYLLKLCPLGRFVFHTGSHYCLSQPPLNKAIIKTRSTFGFAPIYCISLSINQATRSFSSFFSWLNGRLMWSFMWAKEVHYYVVVAMTGHNGCHGVLDPLLMSLDVSSLPVHDQFQLYHFHFMTDCYWAHLILTCCQLTMGTWYPKVKHSNSIRAP